VKENYQRTIVLHIYDFKILFGGILLKNFVKSHMKRSGSFSLSQQPN